jgi:hypothetical protein
VKIRRCCRNIAIGQRCLLFLGRHYLWHSLPLPGGINRHSVMHFGNEIVRLGNGLRLQPPTGNAHAQYFAALVGGSDSLTSAQREGSEFVRLLLRLPPKKVSCSRHEAGTQLERCKPHLVEFLTNKFYGPDQM